MTAPAPYRLAVGERWPLPLAGEGLQALLEPAEQGLAATLVAGIDQPTAGEVKLLRKAPLRLGILPGPPLVWIVLAARGLALDAPYGPGLAGPGRAKALCEAAAQARAWPERARGLLTIAVVDAGSGTIRALRGLTLSRDWWSVLAEALAAAPADLTSAERDAAVTAAYRRYATPEDMLRDCAVVETGGRA